jgi:hypothetical protein
MYVYGCMYRWTYVCHHIADCADITISSSKTGSLPSISPKVTIPGNNNNASDSLDCVLMILWYGLV